MGKRFADIFDALVVEFGPGADQLRVREIAVLKFELEKAQAAGTCSLEDVVRVHNLIARRERELRAGLRRQAISNSAPSSSLRERMIAKHGEVET
jgi:hypothetical protein